MFIVGIATFNFMELALFDSSPFYLIAHLGSWGVWFGWQGIAFPRARARILERSDRPYLRAFVTNILPGVCWGLSQMTLPIVLAFARGGPQSAQPRVLALGVLALGFLLFVSGLRAIGIARAGFLGEYVALEPALCRRQIYARMRHPLFVGGALASAGSTLAVTSTPAVVLLGIANLAILPIYAAIEDRRLASVFGQGYVIYAKEVGAVLPRARISSPIARASRLCEAGKR